MTLNRNIVDGQFVWSATFDADIGHPLDDFSAALFGEDFDDVITGRVDLRDRLAAWARDVGYVQGPDALLAYWFARDARADVEVVNLVDELNAIGVRQVITTNNEARRASYIEREMGFGARVEQVFASGRMGVRKPDHKFFAHVMNALAVSADRMLLVDDHPSNVAEARRCGWRAFHFTDRTRGSLPAQLGLHR